MRVIYRPSGSPPPPPSLPPAGKKRGEAVLVISSEEGISFSGDGYDVKISREALERNGEVRRHENAHMAALGSAAASGIMYNTVQGPGGETIAVGGKIAVDLTEVPGDPAATLSKARRIITAANAAANPSSADMKTASEAYRMAGRARDDMAAERTGGKIDILG